jgi:cell division protein FtsZ
MSKLSYTPSGAKIKVIGLGGGGCNAVTRMVREQIHGVEFIAMNTDAQHLAISEAPIRIQLGERITRGMGAGGDPVIGKRAAEENLDEIKTAVRGADMVFITAGMGGGSGTGSAPLVAEIAKQSGAITIGVVTKPFGFEGSRRMQVAEEGITKVLKAVDTLIIIPNDLVLSLSDHKTGIDSAFKLADQVLHHGVRAIAEVVTVPGLVNLDFADIRSVMKDAGPAWMSIGQGSGQNRAINAVKEALSSPLLDVTIAGAKGVLFNIAGGRNLSLFEVNEAAGIIRQAVDPEANIVFGVAIDPNMSKEIRLTLIATGFINKDMLIKGNQEIEIMKYIKGIAREDLEIPTFFRHKYTSSK